MHELLLFAQVLPSRHDQLLKILAGMSGMQPQRLVERHLIFKPSRFPAQTSAQVGGSQGVQNAQLQALQGQLHNELYYMQLVSEIGDSSIGSRIPVNNETSEQQNPDLREVDSDGESDTGAQSNGHLHEQARQTWTLHFRDIPEVGGRRPVTSRMMSSVDLIDGDAFAFMDSLGYSYVPDWVKANSEIGLMQYSYISEHVLEGHRFIHQNIILLLHRVMRSSVGAEVQGPPSKTAPKLDNLVPLDASGAYVLQASIRIQDGSKPESMTVGINELKAFKELMRGVVDLDIGDRLALDTRLK